jgi:hypothetical protein
MDSSFGIFHGPRCLARYYADGNLLENEMPAKQQEGIK